VQNIHIILFLLNYAFECVLRLFELAGNYFMSLTYLKDFVN
jgi:hypothetical protein